MLWGVAEKYKVPVALRPLFPTLGQVRGPPRRYSFDDRYAYIQVRIASRLRGLSTTVRNLPSHNSIPRAPHRLAIPVPTTLCFEAVRPLPEHPLAHLAIRPRYSTTNRAYRPHRRRLARVRAPKTQVPRCLAAEYIPLDGGRAGSGVYEGAYGADSCG